MAMRMLNRITTVFTNFFVRIDDNLKEDGINLFLIKYEYIFKSIF